MRNERWWGVWCEQVGSGKPGFWRNVSGSTEPLQTTRTEAKRTAKACNEFQETRTDSLGWEYKARPYTPIIMWNGIPMIEGKCPPGGTCLACDRLGKHLEPVQVS